MNVWIPAGIAAAVVLFLVIKAVFGSTGRTARTSYQKRDFLFSPEERFFFTALEQAVGENYEIFGKIPVGDILLARHPGSRNDARRAFQEIGNRRFTFVLCSKTDLTVVCALQLEERSFSGRKSRKLVDSLPAICETAGLPLVRFEAGPLHDPQEIREAIAASVRKDLLYLAEPDGRKEPSFSNLENLDL
jgi:hypothetical protein